MTHDIHIIGGGLAGSEAFERGAVLDGETIHLFGPDGQTTLGYRPLLDHADDDVEEVES